MKWGRTESPGRICRPSERRSPGSGSRSYKDLSICARQLDTAIDGAALQSVVRRLGLVLPGPFCRKTRSVDTALHQRRLDGFGALERKALIEGRIADRIRVPDDLQRP